MPVGVYIREKGKKYGMAGHTHSEENRKLFSENGKKLLGDKNPFYGFKHSEEFKKSQSEKAKKRLGSKNAFYGKKHKEETKLLNSKLATERISTNPIFYNTKPELEMKGILDELNIAYSHPCPIHLDSSNFSVDFYIPSSKIIIEVYGDYWHCNPDKYCGTYYHKNKSVLAEQIWKYDKDRVLKLENAGYKVLIFWESDFSRVNVKRIIEEKVCTKI